jgi:hypothetical protein
MIIQGAVMNKRTACTLALFLAVNASIGLAQTLPVEGSRSPVVANPTTPPLPLPQPAPPAVNPQPGPHNVTVGACDVSGCWGKDATRYNRVGGNTLVGPDGKMCQYVSPGLPLACP